MSDGEADDHMLDVSDAPPGLAGTSRTLVHGRQRRAGMDGSVRREREREGKEGMKERGVSERWGRGDNQSSVRMNRAGIEVRLKEKKDG